MKICHVINDLSRGGAESHLYSLAKIQLEKGQEVSLLLLGRDLNNFASLEEQFNNLAIAINTGTNIPSVATPNGQAAFLFLLTSSLAPLINLSYLRMVYMALPYTIVLSIVGYTAINLFL